MMKKIALVAVLALGLGMVAPQMAEAKDMQGRFGVGADSSLGWAATNPSTGTVARANNTGLSLVYYISKMFGIQLMVSSVITTGSVEVGGTSTDGFAQNTGVVVRGIIPIAFTNEVNLGAVIGFSGIFGSGDNFSGDVDDDDPEVQFISFDLGLRPEWFITDHFSIHTQIGLAISLLNENNFGGGGTVAIDDASGVTIDIFGNADLLGNAGFTFWF